MYGVGAAFQPACHLLVVNEDIVGEDAFAASHDVFYDAVLQLVGVFQPVEFVTLHCDVYSVVAVGVGVVGDVSGVV